jgi:hypothetical protein
LLIYYKIYFAILIEVLSMEKLRRLLALTDSENDHEALSALRAARARLGESLSLLVDLDESRHYFAEYLMQRRINRELRWELLELQALTSPEL